MFFFKKNPNKIEHVLRDGGSTLEEWKNNDLFVNNKWGIQVNCIDIANLIEDISKRYKIKVLKIDVEGSEYHILERLIQKKLIHVPEFVFFEDHTRSMYPSNKEFFKKKQIVQNFVNKNNFKFYNW